MLELRGCGVALSHRGHARRNAREPGAEAAGCGFWPLLSGGHKKGTAGGLGESTTPYLSCLHQKSEYLGGRVTISFQKAV